MTSITPSSKLEPEITIPAISSLPSSPLLDWAYQDLDQINQPLFSSQELMERIKPLTHDLYIRGKSVDGTFQTMSYQLWSKKYHVKIDLELPYQKDVEIKHRATKKLTELLGHIRIKYLDKIEKCESYLSNDSRNSILNNVLKMSNSYVFYDIEDLLYLAVRLFNQDEPDWKLTFEDSHIWMDPGMVPVVHCVLLKHCIENATELSLGNELP